MSDSSETIERGGASGRFAEPVAPPSDMELMLYFDEELPSLRAAEIEEFLRCEALAAAKLQSLSLTRDLVRTAASETTPTSVGLLDEIMGRIEVEASKPSLRLLPGATGVKERGAQAPGPVSKRLPWQGTESSKERVWRRLTTAGVGALAVAASLAFWMHKGPAQGDNSVVVSSALSAAAPAITAEQAPAESASTEPESGGTQVAAVDFGGHAGSVFYVPGDGDEKQTAVIWVSDESSGEQL